MQIDYINLLFPGTFLLQTKAGGTLILPCSSDDIDGSKIGTQRGLCTLSIMRDSMIPRIHDREPGIRNRSHSLEDIGAILDVFQKHGHREASSTVSLIFHESDLIH
jgi:hypothetical protein